MFDSAYRRMADNLLYVLNSFILFLLIAGKHIHVPVWMQPAGRLHPLLLHFPIVLVMLGMLLELFRFRSEFKDEKLYSDFNRFLILTGALFSSVTVIMGLFLSLEPGYSGNLLQWHKWTGVSIAFLASFIYHAREYPWYRPALAKSMAGLTLVFVVLAGHYGASLTHGADFVLEPVLHHQTGSVPLDQALIYEDLVEPVLQKCTGCHNSDKDKGQLILTSLGSVLKGGKSGPVFIAGNPGISLLLRRIHLPEEDKKHMPPAGKPPLTEDDKRLLYYWIKSFSERQKKVTDLGPKDSLRILAANLLKPAPEQDTYDLSPADEKVITRLSSNYRIINPVSRGAAALSVTLYNRAAYSSRQLEELSPLETQVVSLNLNKMPVQDRELRTIARFKNLRTLNLDFTDLTGATLATLKDLVHLHSVSLSGVRLTPAALLTLARFRPLKELALWNTGLNKVAILSFKRSRPDIAVLEGFKDDGKLLKLSPPELENLSPVFKDTLVLQLRHPIRGVLIRYSLNGKAYDSLHSRVYIPGTVFTSDVKIHCCAYKSGWKGSDTVSYSFFRSSLVPDSAWLSTTPEEAFTAEGARTLFDGVLGSFNQNIGWIGYKKAVMELYCKYVQPVQISEITLHSLQYPDALWTNPAQIEVWGGMDLSHMSLLGSLKPAIPPKVEGPFFLPLVCKFIPHRVRFLKILASPGFTLAPKPVVVKPLKKVVKDSSLAVVSKKDTFRHLVEKAPGSKKISKQESEKAATLKADIEAATLKLNLAKLKYTEAQKDLQALTKKEIKPLLMKTKGVFLVDELFIN